MLANELFCFGLNMLIIAGLLGRSNPEMLLDESYVGGLAFQPNVREEFQSTRLVVFDFTHWIIFNTLTILELS